VRIALVGPVYPYRGGIAHYTGMLARALEAERHQVLVVSYRRQYPRPLYPGASDRDPRTVSAAWHMPAECLLDTLWPPTWRRAAARIRAFGPDLVVLQWWTSFMGPLSWMLGRALRRAGLRVVFVVHNVLPHEPRPGDAWLSRRVLAQGHAFLVLSEGELERLHRLLPGARARVVAHPVHTAFGGTAVQPDVARQRLGLAPAVGVILFFGIVRPYKGLRCLLEALARLHQRGQRAHLIVAGEFWEDRRGYDRLVRRLGLDACVHIVGRYIPDEEVGDYFAAADVFAAPYVGGTQSAAVKVAIAFGVPIVTTLPEDVAGQPGGPLGAQVVPRGDPAALAAALGAALSARISGRGRPAARPTAEVVTWERVAKAVAGLA
jgi:glycosyltransferase involved in cell wall biosynthesis